MSWPRNMNLTDAEVVEGLAEVRQEQDRMVPWGWDCIDCQGDFGANDSCDSCGGTNRIQLYATEADAVRFGEAHSPDGTGQ